ncbi:protein ninY [Pantoea sp. PNT03]|uniref:protein ninY n=1 Tax=Pantoea sp. PNT03 TaxID=2769258 RepID=UPI0017820A93|nr:protein ninY [Pantoea sp. PNT03]MBD9658096.1 protein ninY [Pantoea sp. PNT03]
MSKITYPSSTAAVFDDIIFPMHIESPRDIEQELKLAIGWFSRWCNEEKMVVKANLLVSFWGLYLNYEQSMEQAA